ncbi:hypothetical protein BZA77DRAFT_155142 [Pyronema omphalodes]|nr:hypothetical protein BZA77DRAFT_155142 [Pyronema omphalodes]
MDDRWCSCRASRPDSPGWFGTTNDEVLLLVVVCSGAATAVQRPLLPSTPNCPLEASNTTSHSNHPAPAVTPSSTLPSTLSPSLSSPHLLLSSYHAPSSTSPVTSPTQTTHSPSSPDHPRIPGSKLSLLLTMPASLTAVLCFSLLACSSFYQRQPAANSPYVMSHGYLHIAYLSEQHGPCIELHFVRSEVNRGLWFAMHKDSSCGLDSQNAYFCK